MSKPNTKSMFHDALVGAAVSGLLLTGCAAEDKTTDDAPREIGRTEYTNLDVAGFKEICDERGGLTQTHASCGSTNSCRGLIYNTWETVLGDDGVSTITTVVEHTCRAFNSCLGISCVDLPADGGKTGVEIYEETCMGCHGGGHDAADASLVYTHFVAPGGDLDASLAQLNARSDEYLVNVAAFGAVGIHENGQAYSNMPAYHEQYSVAELQRVIEHIRDLEIVPKEMEVLGLNTDIVPAEGE